jgi:hypothetical protein
MVVRIVKADFGKYQEWKDYHSAGEETLESSGLEL